MFHEKVLKHAPWSISKVNMLELCAKQYTEKYIFKHEEVSKNDEAKIGITSHEILEERLKSTKKTVAEIFKEACDKNQLTNIQEATVSKKLEAIDRFAIKIDKFKKQNNVEDEFIEFKLAVNHQLEKCEFFSKDGLLRGVIDQALLMPNKTLIIIDHKSGRKKPIEEHTIQFYGYMLLAIKNFDVEQIQCGINYIGTNKIDWFPRLDHEMGAWTKEEILGETISWLGRYLNKSVSKLNILDEDPKQMPAQPGWQCGWCSFVHNCAEGQVEQQNRELRKLKKLEGDQ